MVTFTIIFYTGPVTTTMTRNDGSPLPPWDPENPSQQTVIELDSWCKKVIAANRVKVSKVLRLTEDIWAELQAADVIGGADADRIKVIMEF